MTLNEAKKAIIDKTVVYYQNRGYIILSVTIFPDKSKKDGWEYKADLTTPDFRGSVAVPMEFLKLNKKGED